MTPQRGVRKLRRSASQRKYATKWSKCGNTPYEFRRDRSNWEQHVRDPHFHQFRGHQIGGKIFEKHSPRTRRIRFFWCGAGVGFRLLSDAGLHGKVAASRVSSWGGPESPSTEDACLRCWLNSDSPDGDGEARHWGCCHRTLVSARARVETRHRTADNFGA